VVVGETRVDGDGDGDGDGVVLVVLEDREPDEDVDGAAGDVAGGEVDGGADVVGWLEVDGDGEFGVDGTVEVFGVVVRAGDWTTDSVGGGRTRK
jgi:hypothetical protein